MKRYRHPARLSENDIYNAMAVLLDDEFGYTIYDDAILEGFTKPCFFIRFITATEPVNKYTYNRSVSAFITFFPDSDSPSESEYLDVMERIHRLFHNGFRVKERHLKTDRISDTRIGDNHDILQSTVSFIYLDYIEKEHSQYGMEELELKMEVNKEE